MQTGGERNFGKKVSTRWTGPGGYKCFCCGPTPKNRRWFRRTMRHRVTRFIPLDLYVV